MRIKPTLRKNNMYMCTFHVPVVIGLLDIIHAMVFHHSYKDETPTSRRQAMRWTIDFATDVDRYRLVGAELLEQYGTMCAIRAAELFPDMAIGVDLSMFSVERVVESLSSEAAAGAVYRASTKKES